jgi:hypothetical protein
MFSKKQQDLAMGFRNEEEIINAVRTLPFCEDLRNHSLEVSRFSIIDLKGENATCEIKSRRINHNQYPTAIIGCNKIDEFNKNNLHNYIVWRYLDGIFYMKYDKESWKYDKKPMKVYRDGICEQSYIYEVPYQSLNKLV